MTSTLKNLIMSSTQAPLASLPTNEKVNQVHESKKRKREERRSLVREDMENHNDEAFAQNEHDLSHVAAEDTTNATSTRPKTKKKKKKKKKRKSMLEPEHERLQNVVKEPGLAEDLEDDAGHEDGDRSRKKRKRTSGDEQENQQSSGPPMTTQVLNIGDAKSEDVVKNSRIEMGDPVTSKSKKREKLWRGTTVNDTSMQDIIIGDDLHYDASQLDSRVEGAQATLEKKKSRKNKFTGKDGMVEAEGLEVNSNHRRAEGEDGNKEASVKSKKFRKSGKSSARAGSVIHHLQDLDSTHEHVQVAVTPPKPKEMAERIRREEDLTALEPVFDSEAIFTSTLNDALSERQPAPLKAPVLTKKQKKRARKDRGLSRNENSLSVGETKTHVEDIEDREVEHGSVSVVPQTLATPIKETKAKIPIVMSKISSSQSSITPSHSQKRLVDQPRNAFSTLNTSQRNRPAKQSSHATPSSTRTPKIPANEPSFSVVYPSETPRGSVKPASTTRRASRTPVTDLEAIDRAVEIFRESHGMSQFEINTLIWEPKTEMNDVQKEFWKIFTEAVPHLTDIKKLKRIVRSRHHNFNRGPWSVEEDEELRDLYESFPNQWSKLSGLINRPPDAIKTRWKHVLINGDNLIGLRGMVRWTLAEEMKLREAVADCIKHIQELRRSNKEFAKKTQGQSDEELIHWQTVSDKMGRTRSFPKCITKWRQLQARAAEEGENLHEYAPSSRQGKGYVEDAKRIARDLQAPEILQMLYAIRVTEAGAESKIPWDRVMGAIEFSTGRKVRSLAHSTCFRKLREKVLGSEDMRLQEVLDVLIDAFEASEPEIPDQFKDHEYIRPIERKVKRQSLVKERRPTSSKYVQDDSDDNGFDQALKSNGTVSLQAGDDTEINNPINAQEVADEETPSEQRRKKKPERAPEGDEEIPQCSQKKKKKFEVVPEGNEEAPQFSQKKKKRRKSKAARDEGLNGDFAGGVDHQGPVDTMKQANLPKRRANSIPWQTSRPWINRDELTPYLGEDVAKALQTIMDSPRIDPHQKRCMRNDFLAAMRESDIESFTTQDEASNKAVKTVVPQFDDSDNQHWLRGRRSECREAEDTDRGYNDEWNDFEDDQDSMMDRERTGLAEQSPSKLLHINRKEGRNEELARKLTLAIDSLLPNTPSLASEDPKQITKSNPAISPPSQGNSKETFSPISDNIQSHIDMGESEADAEDVDDNLLLASSSDDVTDTRMGSHETLASHPFDEAERLDSSSVKLCLGNDDLKETFDLNSPQEDVADPDISNQILQAVIPVRNEIEINLSSGSEENGKVPRGEDSEGEMLLDFNADESQADLMIVEADLEQYDEITQGNHCALSELQHIKESGLIGRPSLVASNRFSSPASERYLPTNPQTDDDNGHSTRSSLVIEDTYEQDSDVDDVDTGPVFVVREEHGGNPQEPQTCPHHGGRAKNSSAVGMIFPSLSETGLSKNVKLGGPSSLFGDEHDHDLKIAISHKQGHPRQKPHTGNSINIKSNAVSTNDDKPHPPVYLTRAEYHIQCVNIEHVNLADGQANAAAFGKEQDQYSHQIESTVITETKSGDLTKVKMIKALLPFGRRTIGSHGRTSTESSVSEQFVDALETQEVEKPDVGLRSAPVLGEQQGSNEANVSEESNESFNLSAILASRQNREKYSPVFIEDLEEAPQQRGQEPDAQIDIEKSYDAEDEETGWEDHEIEQAPSIQRESLPLHQNYSQKFSDAVTDADSEPDQQVFALPLQQGAGIEHTCHEQISEETPGEESEKYPVFTSGRSRYHISLDDSDQEPLSAIPTLSQRSSIPQVRETRIAFNEDMQEQSEDGSEKLEITVPRGVRSCTQSLVDDSEGNLSSRSSLKIRSPKVSSPSRQAPSSEVAPAIAEPTRRNLRTRNKVINYDVVRYFDTHKERESTPRLKQAVQPISKLKLGCQTREAARPRTRKKRKNVAFMGSSDDDIPAEVRRSPQPADDESSSEFGWGIDFMLPAKDSKNTLDRN